MLDDVLRCHSLPHRIDEYLIEVAAPDDLYDMVIEGLDLQMCGCDFFAINANHKVEEGEVEVYLLYDGVDEEENALWLHHSDEGDDDEEVEIQLFVGPFDHSMNRSSARMTLTTRSMKDCPRNSWNSTVSATMRTPDDNNMM